MPQLKNKIIDKVRLEYKTINDLFIINITIFSGLFNYTNFFKVSVKLFLHCAINHINNRLFIMDYEEEGVLNLVKIEIENLMGKIDENYLRLRLRDYC